MTFILFGIVTLGAAAYLYSKYTQKRKLSQLNLETKQVHLQAEEKKFFASDSLSFSEKLNTTKELYPFANWRESFFEYEMEQYTEENCNAAETIFDKLIEDLLELERDGSEKEKVSLFENAILALNKLDARVDGLIETGEREDLCELIDQITLASGLKPSDYADGEGIADLWREW